jgi:hypothetical protein
MGVGGCQECYDDTYKNESFKTSKYMAEINEYINESLNEYLNQRRFETAPLRGATVQTVTGNLVEISSAERIEIFNGVKNIRESSCLDSIVENIETVVENDVETVVETVVPESNECSICYETMGDKNCCVTECGHKFCLKCLLLAMDRTNTCPMCRHVLKDNSRCLGIVTGDRLLNEVDLQGWIDSLPDAGVNLDEDDLDYIIRTFGNTDEVIGVLIENNIIDYDHPLNEENGLY